MEAFQIYFPVIGAFYFFFIYKFCKTFRFLIYKSEHLGIENVYFRCLADV